MSAFAAKPARMATVYVYERVTGYDPKTQKTKTLSTRLLGKILAGSTEMIPTRPKKKRSEVIEAPVQAVRTPCRTSKNPRVGRS